MTTFAGQLAADAAAVIGGEFTETVRVPSGGTEYPAIVDYTGGGEDAGVVGQEQCRRATVYLKVADVATVIVNDSIDLTSGSAGAYEEWRVTEIVNRDAYTWAVRVESPEPRAIGKTRS